MVWRIEYSRSARLDLESMDASDVRRIFEKLEQAAQDPHHFVHRLAGSEEYKLRIGDYWAIVLLIESEKTVFVERIGHRKNIYK